jgi:uncharacterized protein (TIGR03492 family)
VLLPGSRLPEALENLKLMLQMLEQLPPQASPWPMRAALVRELSAEALRELARAQGWQWVGQEAEGAAGNPTGEYASPALFKTVRSVRIEKAGLQLELCWGQFSQLLASSQVVVSMAGTATEQAVGLGKPVLQLAGHGPTQHQNRRIQSKDQKRPPVGAEGGVGQQGAEAFGVIGLGDQKLSTGGCCSA